MAQGSCLCGKVTYEAEIPVDGSGKGVETHLCHCRMCRKITSAYTSSNLVVPASDFTLKSGELKRIRTKHKDDGFEFSILFCPDCGTSIYAEPHIDTLKDMFIIQVGTFDDPVILEQKPTGELNTKHRMAWIAQVEGAEQKVGY